MFGIVGSAATAYMILQWAVPVMQNLYAQYGAIVIIAVFFVIWWLSQKA